MGRLAVGVLMIVAGLVVTLGTYSAASEGGGGHYVVTTGLFVVGLLNVARGLAARTKAPIAREELVAMVARDEQRRRDRDGPDGQIVGKICVYCGERFVVANECAPCGKCGVLLHEAGCAPQHRHA